jgi:hypothetical protein
MKSDHIALELDKLTERLDQLSERVKSSEGGTADPDVDKAVHEAVSALYLRDTTDWAGYFYDILRALDPDMAELVSEDPGEAFQITLDRCEEEDGE